MAWLVNCVLYRIEGKPCWQPGSFKGRRPRGREFGQRRRPAGPEPSKDRESDMFVIRVMVSLLRSRACFGGGREHIGQWFIQTSIQRKAFMEPGDGATFSDSWDEMPLLRIRRDESSVPRCRKRCGFTKIEVRMKTFRSSSLGLGARPMMSGLQDGTDRVVEGASCSRLLRSLGENPGV